MCIIKFSTFFRIHINTSESQIRRYLKKTEKSSKIGYSSVIYSLITTNKQNFMGQVYEPKWLFAKKIKKVWDDIFWKFDFDCIKSSLNKKII